MGKGRNAIEILTLNLRNGAWRNARAYIRDNIRVYFTEIVVNLKS